jgi:hypothetical protein
MPWKRIFVRRISCPAACAASIAPACPCDTLPTNPGGSVRRPDATVITDSDASSQSAPNEREDRTSQSKFRTGPRACLRAAGGRNGSSLTGAVLLTRKQLKLKCFSKSRDKIDKAPFFSHLTNYGTVSGHRHRHRTVASAPDRLLQPR